MAIKKGRIAVIEERNKKIKDMDMNEVIHYLCMKNGQNPDKCEGCLSLSTCNAGQRVMELKADRERQIAEEQKPQKRKHAGGRKAMSEEYILDVLTSENPHEFLMQNEGISYKQARKKLENLHRNHADLFPEWPIRYKGKNKPDVVEPVVESHVITDKEEVSLEEFLDNTAVNEQIEEPHTDDGHNACGIPNELIAKYDEICNEMGKIERQISELKEQYNTLKKAENALSLTMSLIGGRSDVKSVSKLVKFYEKGD